MIQVNDRIYLDLIKSSDAQRLSELGNDLEMRKNVGDTFPFPYTLESAELRINHSHKVNNSEIEQQYAIYIDNNYAGNIGRELKNPSGRHQHNFHVGYWIGREYRGKGYMTEIFQTFSDHLFETHPLCHRQSSGVYSRNPASRRVMEKCGFILEGTQKESIMRDGVFYDERLLVKHRK